MDRPTPADRDTLRHLMLGPAREGIPRRDVDRGRQLLLVPPLVTLTCVILAGCTAGGPSRAAHRATAPSSRPAASTPQATGRTGSPGNPLILSCGQEAIVAAPVPQQPQPNDLAIGPLFIVDGKLLATRSPAGYRTSSGHRARSYKIPIVVTMGSTVTVTIAAAAREQVVIDNPYAHLWGIGPVTSATYHACPHTAGFFAQGFAFTRGQTRGCVPLEVRIGGQPRVRHVTLSLFAGSCAS